MPSRVTNGEEEEDEPQGFQYGIPPMVLEVQQVVPWDEGMPKSDASGWDGLRINFAFALYPLPMPQGHSEL